MSSVNVLDYFTTTSENPLDSVPLAPDARKTLKNVCRVCGIGFDANKFKTDNSKLILSRICGSCFDRENAKLSKEGKKICSCCCLVLPNDSYQSVRTKMCLVCTPYLSRNKQR